MLFLKASYTMVWVEPLGLVPGMLGVWARKAMPWVPPVLSRTLDSLDCLQQGQEEPGCEDSW